MRGLLSLWQTPNHLVEPELSVRESLTIASSSRMAAADASLVGFIEKIFMPAFGNPMLSSGMMAQSSR